ncbi:MAG: 5-(carboxyamino)imidazole ribonucleotide mutase [Eubacteriales bacterium]|nr:5-(carboxyamino)imidazole ribonucleotide mutase [Eubacteriales bacterium]MDD4390511.1 5-(carboxyamino)imidazole ribonucleotide mutase [Eubacteriales bacterium]
MKVAIIMGSKSDYPVIKKAEQILSSFGVEFETHVLSAHRTPHAASEFSEGAEAAGVDVIIAAAGKAAHLAGVMAAGTILPVIGIPIKSSLMDGMDSLLSTVQMPRGIPVATVAVDGAENAALLAIQMIGIKHPELREKMRAYKKKMNDDILATTLDKE